jgi:hypothetical protein
VLATLAVVAFACWWNLGRFHFANYWHRHEFFHYFLGAKYTSELEYTRLYDCVAAAEMQADPRPEVLTRWTRDLRTNIVQPGSPAARDVTLCTSHFTPARWDAFKHDVLWFRGTVSADKWAQMQRDHGYNATPAWTSVGHLLANMGPASTARVIALALIDPVLLIVMWAVVWRTFGWRTLAVAVIWWGTNYPARFNYIGGAFLREDWLVLAVTGIALAKRARSFAAGLAFAGSTLLRVFPGFAAAGVVLAVLQGRSSDGWRDRLRHATAFVAGAAVIAAVVVPISGVWLGGSPRAGVQIWRGFVENSRKHLSGSSTNRVGLKTVLSFDPGAQYADLSTYYLDNPGDVWQAARARAFSERRVVYWMLVVAFVVLLAAAVRGEQQWVALVLGIGLIPIATDITCYYYGILLAYAFLWPRHQWIGVALLALSTFSCGVVGVFSAEDVRYAAISLGVVVFVFGVTGRLAWLAYRGDRVAVATELAA